MHLQLALLRVSTLSCQETDRLLIEYQRGNSSEYLADFFFVSIIITTFVQRNGAIVLSST